MEMEIVLPDHVAVMTLPNVAFFPQALLPLHIFEPRYRQMLKDVLLSHRLFAVAGVNPAAAGGFEPPHRVATVGIIRACQKQDDGTSNLLLQGLARVEFLTVLREEPYRCVRIRPLVSQPGAEATANSRRRRDLLRLITLRQRLGGGVGGRDEFLGFLRTIDDPEAFVDLAAFSLCEDAPLKQTLLETLDVHTRLGLFSRHLRGEIGALQLRHRLQGRLADDDIANN